MYKSLDVLYLTDEADTMMAYEQRGKDKRPSVSAYESGMQALQNMGRIQQVEAMHGTFRQEVNCRSHKRNWLNCSSGRYFACIICLCTFGWKILRGWHRFSDYIDTGINYILKKSAFNRRHWGPAHYRVELNFCGSLFCGLPIFCVLRLEKVGFVAGNYVLRFSGSRVQMELITFSFFIWVQMQSKYR